MAQEGSAGADGTEAAHTAEPDDGTAAAGSSRAGAGDSVRPGLGTSEPLPASLQPDATVQDHSRRDHQVLQPAQQPASPPAASRAAVVLDFMDADGPSPHQAANDAGAAAAASGAAVSNGKADAIAADAAGAQPTGAAKQPAATRQHEAAAPVIDLAFDDASGTAQQAADTDSAAQCMPAPAVMPAAAHATEPASVPAALPIVAAAAAQAPELQNGLPAALPSPPSAPAMPVFRSRVSRMQLAARPALEDEEASDHSDGEMPSGVCPLPSHSFLCWQRCQSCMVAQSSSVHRARS